MRCASLAFTMQKNGRQTIAESFQLLAGKLLEVDGTSDASLSWLSMVNLKFAKATCGAPKPALRSGRARGLPASPRCGQCGRVILFAYLLLSPLVFYRVTLVVLSTTRSP